MLAEDVVGFIWIVLFQTMRNSVCLASSPSLPVIDLGVVAAGSCEFHGPSIVRERRLQDSALAVTTPGSTLQDASPLRAGGDSALNTPAMAALSGVVTIEDRYRCLFLENGEISAHLFG